MLRKGRKLHLAKHRLVLDMIHEFQGSGTYSPKHRNGTNDTRRLVTLAQNSTVGEVESGMHVFCLVSRLQRSSFSRVCHPLLFLRRTLIYEQCELACLPFWGYPILSVSVLHSHPHSMHRIAYMMNQVLAAVGRQSGRYTPRAPRLTSSKMEAMPIKPRQHLQQTRAYVTSQLFGRLTILRLFIARIPQLYMSRTCLPWPVEVVGHQAIVRCQAR